MRLWRQPMRWIPGTKGPIAKGTIRTSFVLGLRLVVQSATLLIVARMLGPKEFGAFAGVAALAVILGTLSTFGTHLVLLSEASKDAVRRAQVLPYAIPSTLFCGGVLLAVYLLVCTLALHESGISFGVLLAIGVTELWLQPLFVFPAMEHLAADHPAGSQLLQILPMALRLAAAATVFGLQLADPLAAYALGYLIASLIALAFATATVPRCWPAFSAWRMPRPAELRETAGYAALNITATSPAELDKTLATKLLPLGAAGLYAAGARAIGATTLPIGAMLLSALPRLFREGWSQPKRTSRLLRYIFVATLAYSVILALMLWFIAPLFVWVFGTKYAGIQHVIHWLCLAVPGMALRMAAGSALMALGKPWMRVGFEITGLAILMVAASILTTYVGAEGMPLALACSEWGMAAIGLALITREMMSPKNRIPARKPAGI